MRVSLFQAARAASWLLFALSSVACSNAKTDPAVSPVGDAGLAADDIDYSFVILGCNRLDELPPSGSANKSTANEAQLLRSFSEIAALNPTPAFVFFTGDMVLGQSANLAVLEAELSAWLELYKQSPLAKTTAKLVPLMGNHESLVHATPDAGGLKEVSNPGAEATFLSALGGYAQGSNGPSAGGPDGLLTDQSRLTYSFTYKDSHFVVLNTDPEGAPATVPLQWLTADIAAARAKSSVRHIFALGHKPAFTPSLAKPDESLDTYVSKRDAFWDLLTGNKATAFLTAHAHMYDQSQWASTSQPSVKTTWQIVAGHAGSSLEKKWAEANNGGYFGFAVINVTKTGRVIVQAHGRGFDAASYDGPSSPTNYPTTIRAIADITGSP